MKTQRQAAISDILRNSNVETQEQLREQLIKRGFSVTQATLSRDMRQMGIVKDGESYTFPDVVREEVPRLLAEAVTDIDYALNTVVFKCHEGMAPAACVALDKQGYKGIVGTLAGDDTIFILMRTEKDAAAFAGVMSSVFFKKGDRNAQ